MINKNSPQLIASNENGWCIFRYGDDKLQLDFGLMGFLLNRHQLGDLEKLLITALKAYCNVNHGTLAADGVNRTIYACSNHNMIIINFDQNVLRFYPPDFDSLAQLCHKAIQTLPPPKLDQTVDYLKNTIRPALSLN